MSPQAFTFYEEDAAAAAAAEQAEGEPFLADTNGGRVSNEFTSVITITAVHDRCCSLASLLDAPTDVRSLPLTRRTVWDLVGFNHLNLCRSAGRMYLCLLNCFWTPGLGIVYVMSVKGKGTALSLPYPDFRGPSDS